MLSKDKRITFLTGAGISAESGIPTFRDKGGIWEKYPPEVFGSAGSFEGEHAEAMFEYCNELRQLNDQSTPNAAHLAIAELEQKGYDVRVVTMNIDDLHERARSTEVMHIHGCLSETKCTDFFCDFRSSDYDRWEIGQLCPNGHQIRPAVVFFDEFVEYYAESNLLVNKADYLVIVGSSASLSHAAGYLNVVSKEANIYNIDPDPPEAFLRHKRADEIIFIKEKASIGVPKLAQQYLKTKLGRPLA